MYCHYKPLKPTVGHIGTPRFGPVRHKNEWRSTVFINKGQNYMYLIVFVVVVGTVSLVIKKIHTLKGNVFVFSPFFVCMISSRDLI